MKIDINDNDVIRILKEYAESGAVPKELMLNHLNKKRVICPQKFLEEVEKGSKLGKNQLEAIVADYLQQSLRRSEESREGLKEMDALL